MKVLKYLTVTLLLLVFISCGGKQPGGTVVARVNDAVLSLRDLESIIDERGLSPAEGEQVVNQWINNELLYQAALQQGLDHDKSIQASVERYRHELLGRQYLDLMATSGYEASPEEITAAYESNLESFYLAMDEARINHFIVESRNEARQIRRILVRNRSGADRTRIFREHNVEAVTVRRGSLIPAIDDALFVRYARSRVIGPISSDYGYHVIEVLERNKEGSYQDIDDAYDEIRHRLFQDRFALRKIEVLDSLRSVTDIEINLGNLNP